MSARMVTYKEVCEFSEKVLREFREGENKMTVETKYEYPKWVRFEHHEKRIDVGWYAINSVSVKDIVPSYRNPGGGVTENDLTPDYEACLCDCISLAEINIREAQRHKRRLEVELERWKERNNERR